MATQPIAIIGGTPDERLLAALKLRRVGIAVFIETHARKKARAAKRAAREVRACDVFDLDSPNDRWYLGRPFAFCERPPQEPYARPKKAVEQRRATANAMRADYHPATIADTLGVSVRTVRRYWAAG